MDIKATLQEFGMFDEFNKAAIDFLSFSDGNLYLFPRANTAKPSGITRSRSKKTTLKYLQPSTSSSMRRRS
ncbi:hypothetical protein [Cohnella faecalis]|uniref:hypothetical protein n=1 Tax=Cohnella faecalis TaxID=2315694 RepID=UPI001F4002E9|nr:hypothetical protein [Cohnella faecalis]